LAKRVAEMPATDDDFPPADKKKIWLLIARHIVEHEKDVSKAIGVLKEFQKYLSFVNLFFFLFLPSFFSSPSS
jgi:hypothetical protein